jgi:hypothetical protein
MVAWMAVRMATIIAVPIWSAELKLGSEKRVVQRRTWIRTRGAV